MDPPQNSTWMTSVPDAIPFNSPAPPSQVPRFRNPYPVHPAPFVSPVHSRESKDLDDLKRKTGAILSSVESMKEQVGRVAEICESINTRVCHLEKQLYIIKSTTERGLITISEKPPLIKAYPQKKGLSTKIPHIDIRSQNPARASDSQPMIQLRGPQGQDTQ